MDNFKFVMPAQIQKSEDGDWKVAGLASTQDTDQQGEIVFQKGIDLSPIDAKKGYFNFDHLKGPENLIGTIEGYKQSDKGLYVHGKLFKNHDRAKAVYQIMSSLSEKDTGRVGLSVEGQILERDPINPRLIKKCRIDKVAVTLNPVNQNTYADLIKSMSDNKSTIDFNLIEDNYSEKPNAIPQVPVVDPKLFSVDQVVEIVKKALSIGAESTKAPADKTGGEALATSDLKPKKKKIKKMEKNLYKSNMESMLSSLQKLYPEYSRTEIWLALKDRLSTSFPDIKSEYPENL